MNVSKLGKAIADEIEKKGHFQGEEYSGVCIITSDAYLFVGDDDLQISLKEAVQKKSGVDKNICLEYNIWEFNDNSPTSKVLEVLRSL